MQYLRQSTSATVVIGPVWATADGVLKADLAYDAAGINCDIYKNGTKADITLANSAGDGYFRAASGEALYLLTLSTGHTDTLGRLEISLSATGYYMKPRSYMVVPANVWDSLFGADYLQVDAVQVEGSDATNQIRDAVVDDATRIDASALNTLSGHDPGEAIMGATDLGTGAGLTSLASAANLATVAGYVDTEVGAIKAVTDKLDTALELDSTVYRFTTNALEQAPTGGSAPTAAAIADAVLDEAMSGHTTAGTLGKAVADTLADTNELQTDWHDGGRLDLILDAASAPSAADVADAVWDEAIADHDGVGSTGQQLAAAGAAGDPWDTALPGAYPAGDAGHILGALPAAIAALVGIPSFTVASAVSASGDAIELVQGDDYANGDARALSWSSTSWPDLTSASVTLYVKQGAGVVDIAGSVVSAGGATQTVRVEPTHIETAALDAGMEKFHLEAVLDGGHVVTLAYGTVNVIADVST